MTSLTRNVACALAVSAAWGAISASVFLAASAVLPRPERVAGVFTHHDDPRALRVDSTVARAGN